ncbi:MAG: glycosyltransferase family 4 protein [Desulfosarcina sp.]|nr:glycosyltransferase family 4 protein [Desulfosarcina sp.]
MRFLIVSRSFPENLATDIHGVFKRFKMLLDAIKEIAEIDLLYYVPPGTNISPFSVAQLKRSISTHFEAPIRLFLCERSDNRNLNSKFIGYGLGAFSIVRQPAYSNTAGAVQVRAFEACLHYNPDAVFVHRLGSMCPLLKTRKALPPVFFDLDDIEHVAFKRGLRYLGSMRSKLLNMLLFPALYRGEYKAIQLAHRTFVCSDNDLEYLTHLWRLKGVVKIPNAVEIPSVQPISSEQTLLFLGTYQYKPNIDAAEYLIQEVWPLVHKELPKATLIIAGSSPNRISTYRSDAKSVRFSGFVEDLEGLYRQSRVVCAPILSGSGTRVKILEAAAHGKPIVSTKIGAEGLQMRDDYDIMIRDDPKSFADACIRLLNDHDLCKKFGAAARAVVLKKYDKTKIKRMIQEIIKESI